MKLLKNVLNSWGFFVQFLVVKGKLKCAYALKHKKKFQMVFPWYLNVLIRLQKKNILKSANHRCYSTWESNICVYSTTLYKSNTIRPSILHHHLKHICLCLADAKLKLQLFPFFSRGIGPVPRGSVWVSRTTDRPSSIWNTNWKVIKTQLRDKVKKKHKIKKIYQEEICFAIITYLEFIDIDQMNEHREWNV